MVLFKKIDWYMLRLFLLTLLVVIVSVGVMIIIINMVERLRYFIDNEMPILQIIEYYLYYGGWVIKSFFPVFVLLSALFTVSILARKNEILAMKATGLSLYRITLPFLVITMILSAGHFYYSEYIYPPANQKRLEMKEFIIKNRSRRTYEKATNLYRQISPGYFYTMAMFNLPQKEGKDLKVYRTQDNHLRKLITANEVKYANGRWLAYNGVVREFDDSLKKSFTAFDTLSIFDIKDKPDELTRRLGQPEDMGYEELKEYINLMKRTGAPYNREAIDLQVKFAFPITSIIVVMFSVPFASNTKKGGIAVSFAIGALMALIYFVSFRILQSAGYNEKVPEYIAIWGVNAVFFVVGLVALITARK